MRKINITISIDDDDVLEHRLKLALDDLLGKSIIDYMVFPNTEHLKDNENFNKLIKAKKQAGLELDRFINNNRK
jgi:hypothetical protein